MINSNQKFSFWGPYWPSKNSHVHHSSFLIKTLHFKTYMTIWSYEFMIWSLKIKNFDTTVLIRFFDFMNIQEVRVLVYFLGEGVLMKIYMWLPLEKTWKIRFSWFYIISKNNTQRCLRIFQKIRITIKIMTYLRVL